MGTNKTLPIFLLLISIVFFTACQNNGPRPVKVFLFAGQSNMDGCGKRKNMPDAYKAHPDNTLTWDNKNKQWVALEKDSFATNREYHFGPEIGFSHQLAKAFPNHTIAVVKTSGGGTSLWKHWSPGMSMYNRFTTNIQNALKQLDDSGTDYEVCGILWMQGETDSGKIESAEAYEKNLVVFFDDIKKQIGKNSLPIVMGRISSSLLKKTPWNFDHTKIVQKSQENVAAKDPHVFIINTDKLTTWEDNTHFDAASQIWLGNKMAEIMLEH